MFPFQWILLDQSDVRTWHFVYGSLFLVLISNGTPLQYSCLENPMDRGAWKTALHGIAEGRTQLSDFTFTFHFYASEKEMATHYSVLAWRIPGMGEPGGLLSMGSHRVGHDWTDLAATAAAEFLEQLKEAGQTQREARDRPGHPFGEQWMLQAWNSNLSESVPHGGTRCLRHRMLFW